MTRYVENRQHTSDSLPKRLPMPEHVSIARSKAGTVSEANGTAERRAAEALLKRQARCGRRITIGADKAYDTRDHVAALRVNKMRECETQSQIRGQSATVIGRTKEPDFGRT